VLAQKFCRRAFLKIFQDGGTIQDGFYLPQMEYEGSIGLVPRKMKKNYC
jgi:hypothetical protein